MINTAHLHLILNHFPIIGTTIVVIVMGYGVIKNDDKFKKFGLFLLILISLITIPVFFTGGKAAGIVKGMDGILEENIEPHEDFARLSFIAMEISGIISVICLFIFKKGRSMPVWLGLLVLLLIIAVNLMMVYAGHLGGKISHFELMNKL
ncbi:MAG: hypothetical protein PHN88_13395 [Ignavibacteria bacterium]|nr:hypothetical protein [Ignavibacteria bacterium]